LQIAYRSEPLRENLFVLLSIRSIRVWLTPLSRERGRPATLHDIPDADLDRLAGKEFDSLWFLSVWHTGLAGQRTSRQNPEWQREFRETLPDVREEDIPGFGFAITATGRDGGDLQARDCTWTKVPGRLDLLLREGIARGTGNWCLA